ncbi:MAG: hypothetical protein LBT48_03420 [Prevotellaceae bacterium]|nr:hypothetical protein [Prevotellaceae bacterium]
MPHHHHGEAVCVADTEQCPHTEDEHRHVHCIADTEYVTCENHETHCKTYCCAQPHHVHFIPVIAAVLTFADAYALPLAATRYKHGTFVSSGARGSIATPHGLRAPPAASPMQA